MTRTLGSIKEINLSWLKETLLEVKEFQDACKQYLDGLSKQGIKFGPEELERNMMLSLLAMTNFPVIGGANVDKENERSMKLFEAFAERIFSAIEDYDAMRFIA